MARWIGVSHRVGQAMYYWLLPECGTPIACTTIQPISEEEQATFKKQESLKTFNETLDNKFKMGQAETQAFQLYREDEETNGDDDVPYDPEAIPPDTEDDKVDTFNELLLTEPLLERDGVYARAQITGRKCDNNGNLIGTFHRNPILNKRVYLATFLDGHIAEYSANVVAEAIYKNVNDDGIDSLHFDSII